MEFERSLQNGVALAKVARRFCPGCVPRIYDEDQEKGLEFRHTDNINYFFKAMRQLAFPRHFMFELVDLYDLKNMPKVIYCIHVLSHFLHHAQLAPEMQKTEAVFAEELLDQKRTELAEVKLPAFDNIEEALKSSRDNLRMSSSSELGTVQPEIAPFEKSALDSEETPAHSGEGAPAEDAPPHGQCACVQTGFRRWRVQREVIRKQLLTLKLQCLARVLFARQAKAKIAQKKHAMQALLMDHAHIVSELMPKIHALKTRELDAFEFSQFGAEQCRFAVLQRGIPCIGDGPRPTVHDLSQAIIRQHALIRHVPAFFNYGRGQGCAAWAELVISLMHVRKELAKEALLALMDHTLVSAELKRALLNSSLSISESVDAFMRLVCRNSWLVRVIQHASIDESFYYLSHIASSTVHQSLLRAIWSKEPSESEIVEAWRMRLQEVTAKSIDPALAWPVCYVSTELGQAFGIEECVFVEPRLVPRAEYCKEALSSLYPKIACELISHPKQPFWLKLISESFGIQPTVVKEWRAAKRPLPVHGLYARSALHLSKKGLVLNGNLASGPLGSAVVVFWSDAEGEFWVQVGHEQAAESVRLDALLHCASHQVSMGGLIFDADKLVRLLCTKLVLPSDE